MDLDLLNFFESPYLQTKDPNEEENFNDFAMLVTFPKKKDRHCRVRKYCFVEYNDTKFINKIFYIYDFLKFIFDSFFKIYPKLSFLKFS